MKKWNISRIDICFLVGRLRKLSSLFFLGWCDLLVRLWDQRREWTSLQCNRFSPLALFASSLCFTRDCIAVLRSLHPFGLSSLRPGCQTLLFHPTTFAYFCLCLLIIHFHSPVFSSRHKHLFPIDLFSIALSKSLVTRLHLSIPSSSPHAHSSLFASTARLHFAFSFPICSLSSSIYFIFYSISIFFSPFFIFCLSSLPLPLLPPSLPPLPLAFTSSSSRSASLSLVDQTVEAAKLPEARADRGAALSDLPPSPERQTNADTPISCKETIIHHLYQLYVFLS